jgi:hypothetical protein
MLVEAKHVVQNSDEATRRWFYDKDFDLYTWQNMVGEIVRFELCYDKSKNERALIWDRKSGYAHVKVDDGEEELGRYKMSPIFAEDGVFDYTRIGKAFKAASKHIEQELAQFVYSKILGIQKGYKRP